jgi:hypothetical protein
MPASEPVSDFIRSSFRSVWSFELMLHLKKGRDREWSTAELIEALRGSSLIVSQSLEALVAAGLVSIDQRGCARFQPVTADLGSLAEQAERLYVRSPDAVRRMIMAQAHPGLTTFANAFRLWKD